MKTQPTVLRLSNIVDDESTETKYCFAVLGDIHGQYSDIWTLVSNAFRTASAGRKEQLKYIWLGDYVDRGLHNLVTATIRRCSVSLIWRRDFPTLPPHPPTP